MNKMIDRTQKYIHMINMYSTNLKSDTKGSNIFTNDI